MDSKFTLRHANRADKDAEVLAKAVLKNKPNKIAVIYIENDWAVDYNKHFSLAVKANASPEIIFESHPTNEVDFRSLLTKVINKKPDILVVNSFGLAAGSIILQARNLNFTKAIYASNGFALSQDAVELVNKNKVKDFYYQDYQAPPAKFIKLYEDRFQTRPTVSALAGFTDFELLGTAAAEVGLEPFKIIQKIKGLQKFSGEFQELSIDAIGDMLIFTVVREWG